MVGAQCGVIGDVEAKQIVHGSPHMPYKEAKRAYTLLRNLPEIVDRLKQLEKLARRSPKAQSPKPEIRRMTQVPNSKRDRRDALCLHLDL